MFFCGRFGAEGRFIKLPEAERLMKNRFNDALYVSPEWIKTRTAYAKSKGGLCERCLQNGIVKAGEIVHHKIHLTPVNIHDPSVTLDWKNLELLCRECHAKEHGGAKRYKVDALGRVTPR